MNDATPRQAGFRALQTICDLRALARAAPRHVADRIASGTDGMASAEDFADLVGNHGCRLSTRAHVAMHHGLVVAATLPDDDPDAFQAATAILLADRLQSGRGRDDLFWHWDGFQDAYDALPPAPRAAILQGYAQATRDGFAPLMDPPEGPRLATRPRAAITAELSTVDGPLHDTASTLKTALRDADQTPTAARAWEDLHASPRLTTDDAAGAVLAAFRHLFETRLSFDPFRDRLFDLAAPDLPVIPPTP